MFQNQLTVFQKVTDYLNAKKEACVEAFQALTVHCNTMDKDSLQFVLMMMPHEHLEVYLKSEQNFAPLSIFQGVFSNYELEELMRYDYDENQALEDFTYWQTSSLAVKLFEMWLAQCFHEAGCKEKLEVPVYYMSVPESDEVFIINELKTKMRKETFEDYCTRMKKWSMVELGL